jgi:ABC-2 type transport system permease protein
MWFEEVLSDLSIFGGRLVPFHWIARGLKQSALGKVGDMVYYLGLIWANGLFAYLATLWIARHLYRRGLNRAASGGTLRRRYGGAWLDALVARAVFFLDAQTRLLIVKDFRTFRRDPAQWVQIVIFLGLAAFYLPNMRRFYEQELDRSFKNPISLLMLTACAMLMCAYTARFIFPMLSLEGRKFWILGLLPMDRARLIWGKFAFSATGCFLAGEFLAILSGMMLAMPPAVVFLHASTIGTLALGLSGLSVGIGACLPNFRETDPSKITMGFGGMLNVIAGILLLLVLVTLMAAPAHLVLARAPDQALALTDLLWWVWAPHLVGLVLGLAAAIVPLRVGVRTLRAMEF